ALDQVALLHRCIAGLVGGAISQDQGYPAWAPDPASPLLAVARRAVRLVTGREASVRAIHAGLECGVIKARFPGMDAVSIGPTITGPHSPDERVHIPSVGEFYRILTEILESAGHAPAGGQGSGA
ncbi:MAG: cytosol nonspecific dipeptidase, partial [Spirochaetota bacterium]